MDKKPVRSLGGFNLRRVREASKLSQCRFAIMHEYNPSTISLWETGRSLPDLKNAYRLQKDFGIDPGDWLAPAPREPRESARAAAS